MRRCRLIQIGAHGGTHVAPCLARIRNRLYGGLSIARHGVAACAATTQKKHDGDSPLKASTTPGADQIVIIGASVAGMCMGCRAALPLMGAGGSIVHVSSVYGQVGGAQVAAYCAAKGGVTLLTRSAARHGATLKPPVRVNAIHPSFVDTPMVQGALDQRDAGGGTARARIEAFTPLGRLATPEEIVGVFLLLASDEGRHITGSQFTVDGGITAQ
ncbi:SDR family NAD(P)-dependent oxidoreductase [Cupriavidus basilensis]|uniref:SDR family NAD(P)-dependent oxidoreductase n=1 Tax=Cupriavidus basilensis TaxID=68895 RepID=UPI00157B2388